MAARRHIWFGAGASLFPGHKTITDQVQVDMNVSISTHTHAYT